MSGAAILHHIRALAAGSVDTRSDAELVHDFATRRDETAFTALLRRHGPLVWGVCRRLLPREQDAEDAFQTAFLVLARRAASIRRTAALGGWLYSVACRTALNARRAAAARCRREQQVSSLAPEQPVADASLRELQVILDEEVQGLPEKLRTVFVLCCLQGHSKSEAACELGWREGTVSSRLARARNILRSRLTRRGVSIWAALTAVALQTEAVTAVPLQLVTATTQLAAIVPRAARWKLGTAILAAMGMAAGGWGLLVRSGHEPNPPARAAQSAPGRAAPGDQEPLPAGAIARLGTLRFREGSWVRGVALSLDGKTLASVTFDGVRLWDPATGLQRKWMPVEASGGLQAVALAPDGRTVAVGGDSAVYFLEATSGKVLHLMAAQRVLSLAFSPDGKTIAAGQLSGGLVVGEAASGKVLAHLRGHQDPDGTAHHTHCLAFSADGRFLAWGEGPRRIFRDLRAESTTDRDGGHGGDLHAMAFSADGKVLATSGSDRAIRLWDAASGKPLGVLEGHKVVITSLAFSPDGRLLASGSGVPLQGNGMEPHAVRLWDIAAGKELACLGGHGEGVSAVCFSPDGRVLYSGEDISIRRWDVAGRKELPVGPGHCGWIGSIAFSPDGKLLATTGSDRTVRLWDTATRQESRVLTGCQTTVDTVAFSPDGRKVACGSRDGHVHLWDAATGKEVAVLLVGEKAWEAKAAFSPDGKLLAAGSRDGQIVLSDAATGKEVRRFSRSDEGVMALAFSPDGTRLAVGCINNFKEESGDLLRLWDVASGREIRRFVAQPEHMIRSVAFSPDGRRIACAEWRGYIHLWDAASGKSLWHTAGRGSRVNAVAFSPDGHMIASTGYDDVVGLWETATGALRKQYTGHRGYVEAPCFFPDGKLLATGGWDSTVLLWDIRRTEPAAGPVDREALWADLMAAGGAKAYQAILRLSATPGPSVRFLRERLRPAKGHGQRAERLVTDLDSDDFRVREKAAADLEAMGEEAEPALRRALEGKPSAEVRRRAERLLEKMPGTPVPATLRALRAIEVLEYSGTPEARDLLKALAAGYSDARQTREAKAALVRLSR
jgi:RNA polymerase sigma factor (sigma-70 family)